MAKSEVHRQRDKLADRIADAEERLRQSIAQRIERNRTSLAQLQREHHTFETAFSPVGNAPTLDVTSFETSCISTHSTPSSTAAALTQHQEVFCSNSSTSNEIGKAANVGVAETVSCETHNCSRAIASIRESPTEVDSQLKHHTQKHGSLNSPVVAANALETESGDAFACGDISLSSSALLLRMTVEIGDGRTGEVRVRHGDQPENLARMFCKQHGLGERAIILLTQYIATNLADVVHLGQPGVQSSGSSGLNDVFPEGCQTGLSSDCNSLGTSRSHLSHATASKASERRGTPAAEKNVGQHASTIRSSDQPQVKSVSRRRARSAPRPMQMYDSRRSNHSGMTSDVSPDTRVKEGEPTINERSRRLIAQRGDRGNVFLRLHQENEDIKQRRAHLKSVLADEEISEVSRAHTTMSYTSRKLLALRGYDNTGSIGERLYADGLRLKAKRVAASKAAEALLDPEVTFRPKLSGSSNPFSSSHVADPWRRAGQMVSNRTGSYSERSHRSEVGNHPSIWEVQYMEAEQRRAERQLLQQLYAVDQQRECSHRPLVSRSSREIDASRRKRSASATARLIRTKETSSVTDCARVQQQRWDDEKPRQVLPPRVEAPRIGHSIHDSLFADAKEKRRVQLQREAAHDAKIEEQARTWSARELDPTAFNRLCYAHRQKEVELQALRDYLASHEDPTSGRPLFKPHITRGPRYDGSGTRSVCEGGRASNAWEAKAEKSTLRADTDKTRSEHSASGHENVCTTSFSDAPSITSSSRCDVGLTAHLRGDSRLITGEAFHSHRVKYRRSRDALREHAREQIVRDHQMPVMGAFTTGGSDHIVESIREQRISELFRIMDVNGEGVLDGKDLDDAISRLPGDISSALYRVSHMHEYKSLTLSDFKNLVTRALKQTTPSGPRYSLLPHRGTASSYANGKAQQLREQQAECRFKPTVDANSIKLAASRRDPSKGIVEQLFDEKANYAARLKAAQRAAISQVEADCPFHPIKSSKSGGANSDGGMEQQNVETATERPRPRSRSESNPRPLMPSSVELELSRHCTFRPRINNFAGIGRRVDIRDPHDNESLMAAFHSSYIPRKHSKNPTGYSQLSSTGYPDHTKVGAVSSMAQIVSSSAQAPSAWKEKHSEPPPVAVISYANTSRDSFATTAASVREPARPHSAYWGVYSSQNPSALTEHDSARALQLELEQEVAQLSDPELPTKLVVNRQPDYSDRPATVA